MSSDTVQVLRAFVTLAGGRQMHYRRAGAGPVVLLLHPSPQSSAFSLPMLRRLAANFTVIAVDTPGYGLSEPLSGDPATPALADYLPAFVEFMDAMGLRRVAFYGNATGAEIAQLFAFAHPERVALCMLDTAGHKEDADLDAMLGDYFPDVTPRRDGGHLLTHWDMVRSLSLFSPWQKTDAAHQLPVDLPPPRAIHAKMLDYLRAGANYPAAYRPAFYTAKHALISRIPVPATLTRWEGKPDLSEVDELIARGLPSNFTVLRAGPTLDDRLGASERHLLQHYRPTAEPARASPPQSSTGSRSSGDVRRALREFIPVSGGELLVRRSAGPGRPVLLLHDAGSSSRGMCSFLEALQGKRAVLAADFPGCGESTASVDSGAGLIAGYARAVGELLDQVATGPVDVVARGLGCAVAVELSRQLPQRVNSRFLLSPPLYDARDGADLARLGSPDLSPRWDGSHLVTAWSVVRDARLFWPFFRRERAAIIPGDARLDPSLLQQDVEDLLLGFEAWPLQWRELLEYPLADHLAGLPGPTLLGEQAGTPTAHRVAAWVPLITPRLGGSCSVAPALLPAGGRALQDALLGLLAGRATSP